MGTPAARRITFGTAVTPRIEALGTDTRVTREEGTVMGAYDDDKIILDTTIGKRFGGKGIATINKDQDIDGWVSFFSPVDDEIQGIDDKWNNETRFWDEVFQVTATDHTLRADAVTCNFLYIKNLGVTLAGTAGTECRIFLDGTEPDILLPTGASIAIRLNSISSNNVKVDTASGSTTIEYVLAKE